MQYTEAVFSCSFVEDWQEALFTQSLADLGFESFVSESGVLKAYVQTSLLAEPALQQLIAATPEVLLLSLTPCPDENWNQTWEEEHPEFQVHVADQTITIRPHCAFGAGYHATTSMMLAALADRKAHLSQSVVLDNGCGTGILAIAAARLGAKEVVAVDMDEKSVQNTLENSVLNQVTLHVRLADTPPEGNYNLILSNIHRNVLLQQMPLYAHFLCRGGQLWLSGFLEDDCPALLAAADREGLHLTDKYEKEEWRMLCLSK